MKKKTNNLALDLALDEDAAFVQLWLSGKKGQTPEEIEYLIDLYTGQRPILELIQPALLTYPVCFAAVSKNAGNLEFTPKNLIDEEMVIAAVRNDGSLLRLVPERMRSYAVCRIAVENDYGEIAGRCAMEAIPQDLLAGNVGRGICSIALQKNAYSIKYVPRELLSQDLVTKALARIPSLISWVPARFINQEIVNQVILKSPKSINDIPKRFLTTELLGAIIDKSVDNLRYLTSTKRLNAKLLGRALSESSEALRYVPDDAKLTQRCYDAVSRNPEVVISTGFPEHVRECLDKTCESLVVERPLLPALEDIEYQLRERRQTGSDALRPLEFDSNGETICYISDIHLEYQIDMVGKSLKDIIDVVDVKVREMVSSAPENSKLLLVAGDVAQSVGLEAIFYHSLSRYWDGGVVSVLGNHELWNVPLFQSAGDQDLDEVIERYRKAIERDKYDYDSDIFKWRRVRVLLENQLLILYKGRKLRILDEETILASEDKELEEICSKSSLIVLGGLGFSGRNPRFNADSGVYRSSINAEEDQRRSARFESLYKKVKRCASAARVIVLSHTPFNDWTSESLNEKWIYVSGHTHWNFFSNESGAMLFSDNQIGYDSARWSLKSFDMGMRYDPFRELTEGIHKVDMAAYFEFNLAHGVRISSMKSPGDIYLIKRACAYMFVLQDTEKGKLYLLEGGKKRSLSEEVEYYYEMLPIYVAMLKEALGPFDQALRRISQDVKAFGGSGRIHGSIVDINYWAHLYVNPFDGKVTPYFAFDQTRKMVFPNMRDLLMAMGDYFDNFELLERYDDSLREGSFKLLDCASGSYNNLVTAPEVYFDRKMYTYSGKMKAAQYLLQDRIVRVWDDSIINNFLIKGKRARLCQ